MITRKTNFKTRSQWLKQRLVCAVASIFVLCCLSQISMASELYDFFRGVRQVGMGGASIAVVNDETALLSNPAALGKLRSSIITILDPEISVGSGLDTLGTTNTSVMTDPQLLLTTLNTPANRGKHIHMKASVFPSMVFTNFGIGLYGTQQVNADVDTAATNFRLDYTNDYALVMGYNFRLLDGRLKIGVSGRAINRVEIHKDIDPNTTGLQFSQLISEGQGVAADGGLILTGPWTWLPALSAVVRDIGDTTFNLNNGFLYRPATQPQTVNQSVDAGFSLSPILGKGVRMQLTGEYRGVTTASDELDSMKRIHAGVEFNFYDSIFLRGGMNQRYWTAGIEVSMLNFQVQAASYGEEIGTSTTNREDRRYVGKLAFRF